MEYKFKSVFCLGINGIEAEKEIGLEKLDEFPELNSMPKEKVKELEKENMHKKKKSNVYAKSKYFDTKGFMRSRKRLEPMIRIPTIKKMDDKKIWTISRFVRVILAQGPC
ncbi:hypothetical protein Tco_1293702 [Tanacetum coccineum]